MEFPLFHEARHIAYPLPHWWPLLQKHRLYPMQLQPVCTEQSAWSAPHDERWVRDSREFLQCASLLRNATEYGVGGIVEFRRDGVFHANVSMLPCVDASFQDTERVCRTEPPFDGVSEILFGVLIWKNDLKTHGKK